MSEKTPEFMLEEYKQIANGYQDLHAQQNELIKFYLTLVAVPASVLAVVAQFFTKLPTQASSQSFAQASPPASVQVSTPMITQIAGPTANPAITPTVDQLATNTALQPAPPDAIIALAMPILLALLVALLIIGFAVVMALVTTRAEALLYVKTVNGVRRYFVEHDLEGRLNKYLVLPDVDTLPRYWEGVESRAFWNVFMVASLNGAVFFATCLSFLWWLGLTQGAIVISIIGAILWFGLQEFLHWRIMNTKDKNHKAKFSSSFPIKGQVIGVDLDGVLGDLAEGVIRKAETQYGVIIGRNQITSHRLQDCTSLTEAQLKEIFESTDVFQTLTPIPGAREAVRDLHSKKWIVQVITDRFWTEQDWSIAKSWLEKNGF
jgi:hypothetical protein